MRGFTINSVLKKLVGTARGDFWITSTGGNTDWLHQGNHLFYTLGTIDYGIQICYSDWVWRRWSARWVWSHDLNGREQRGKPIAKPATYGRFVLFASKSLWAREVVIKRPEIKFSKSWRYCVSLWRGDGHRFFDLVMLASIPGKEYCLE